MSLVLDLVSAVYEAYLPVARTPSNTSQFTTQVSPLLATPPVATPDISSSPHGADLSGARARKHMLSHLAERAFGVVLACMREREHTMHESGEMGSSGAQMSLGETDSLRAFLQRTAGTVVCARCPPLLARLCRCDSCPKYLFCG